MSAFEIALDQLDGKVVEKELCPDAEALAALFADLDGDVRLGDPEKFSARVRAQMSGSTIHVSGRAQAEFSCRCGRCLTRRPFEVDTDIDFVLMSQSDWSSAYAGKEEIALSEEDLDVSYYTGDSIDLAELIREAILLELPSYPRCPPQLEAECDQAFEARVGANTLQELEGNKLDPRWAALRNLKISDSGEIQKGSARDDKKSRN